MIDNSYKHKQTIMIYLRLLRYLRPFLIAFLLGIVGNTGLSVIDSALMYLLKPILNKGFMGHDMTFIHVMPFIIISMFIMRGLASFTGTYFIGRVTRSVVMVLRQDIFKKLLVLPASYYDRTTTGQVLSTILYNVEQVANAGADTIIEFVQSSVLIIGLVFVMFSVDWKLSLFFLIAAPLISAAVSKSTKRMRHLSVNVQNQMGDVTTIAEEAVEGYQVVRAFGGEEYEQKKFSKAVELNRHRELKVIVTKSLTVACVQLITGIALCATIYFAAKGVWNKHLTAGEFTSLVASMIALLKPLKSLTNLNATIQKGLAGAQSVFELLDLAQEPDNGKIHLEKSKGSVRFDNVNFCYPIVNKSVLSDVSFEAKAGTTVALVGRSGSGKSTLVRLLQRFYVIDNGHIYIDDKDINDIVLKDLRKQFAVVSQHVILFNDTVANNIAYGLGSLDYSTIVEAAKAANAWDFIQQLPDGLNTIVGEDGVLLSGGQRQRIAIARAILKNAPILIFDEATSALDTESERQIQSAISTLMKGRTSIVIAHRLSTIESADMIVVLDGGNIVESGTHQKLISQDGYYAKLHKMQFKDN